MSRNPDAGRRRGFKFGYPKELEGRGEREIRKSGVPNVEIKQKPRARWVGG